MVELDKTIERLETAMKFNSIGFVVHYDTLSDALELLKSQQAEIERLKEMQRVDNCERCRFKDKCLTGRQLSR